MDDVFVEQLLDVFVVAIGQGVSEVISIGNRIISIHEDSSVLIEAFQDDYRLSLNRNDRDVLVIGFVPPLIEEWCLDNIEDVEERFGVTSSVVRTDPAGIDGMTTLTYELHV